MTTTPSTQRTSALPNAYTSGRLPRWFAPTLFGTTLVVGLGVTALLASSGAMPEFSIVLAVLLGVVLYAVLITIIANAAEGRRAATDRLVTSLVITACYVAVWQVMYYGFMPDFFDKYIAFALEKARQGGASEADLARQAADLRNFAVMYQNPLVNIAFSLLEPLPVGLVFTLVTAGVLGRRGGRPDGGA